VTKHRWRIVAISLFVAQLLVFGTLTRLGWGDGTAASIAAPQLETLGAPPGLRQLYADLSHVAFPVENDAGSVLATAAYAGTPGDWAHVVSAGGDQLHPLSENPLTTVRKLTATPSASVLFLVPSVILSGRPLWVSLRGHRQALRLLDVDAAEHFAVMATDVKSDSFDLFRNSLLWLTKPAPQRLTMHLALIRVDPTRDASVGYALTTAHVATAAGRGTLDDEVSGVGIGTPVVAYSPQRLAMVGAAENLGMAYVTTSRLATTLRAVSVALQPPTSGSGRAGMSVRTTALANLDGQYDGNQVGALVESVTPGSAAAKAGLQPGDVIESFDGRAVNCASALIAAIRASHPGTLHTLSVITSKGASRDVNLRPTAYG
jgi:hypothetical protein